MDTAPLKTFATRSRTALIREVTARIAVVLAPASPQRVEQPKAVAALEAVITGAGGGDKGRGAVANRVAYTWFNRIIALRFMDANGYTGIGVVSPQAGVDLGQPEILAEAKRGNIDSDVVSQNVRESVSALLNGTRRSGDPQGEAYELLLVEYCRNWNRAMPFMFERQGDFTELLMPANLLADDSVLNRAVTVLTEAVCQDVEVIGWLYQFYISERKDEVFASFKKNKKAGADEIPAVTQLFTPHWIVRYLVENSLGRLWMLNNPSSRLAEQMDYYIPPVDLESEFLKINSPEDLKVIDPACGSGHMLTYAFDLLYLIYEELGYTPSDIPGLILRKNLFGTEIDSRAGALAAFALTMKARGRQRTFFNQLVNPNVLVLEPISFSPEELEVVLAQQGDREAEAVFWQAFTQADVLGSLVRPHCENLSEFRESAEKLRSGVRDLFASDLLDRALRVLQQADYLSKRYAIAIANPPYMGSKNMCSALADRAKSDFPDSKADLFAMFMERSGELVVDGGLIAMVTMHSWMFLSSFAKLRERLLATMNIEGLAHLGSGAFDSIAGDVVATAAFVLSKPYAATQSGTYLRLTADRSELAKSNELARLVGSPNDRFVLQSKQFLRIPGCPIAYWLTGAELHALSDAEKIADHATLRKGLVTLDDARFTRKWFEVGLQSLCLPDDYEQLRLGRKWYPLNKGGGYRKWYGLNETVINWGDNGRELKDFIVERYGGGSYTKEIRSEEYYFQESVTWGAVSSGLPSFRYTPRGFIFSSGGSALFTEDALLSILGVLNSSAVSGLLQTLTPTMNFVSGDVARMPYVSSGDIDGLVREAVAISVDDWNDRETSWDFSTNKLIRTGLGHRLSEAAAAVVRDDRLRTTDLAAIQSQVDRIVAIGLGLEASLLGEVSTADASQTIDANEHYEFPAASVADRAHLKIARLVADLISYAVGCMFGRFSLDLPGLLLADQGDSIQDYFAKVPKPTFMPDVDNVIPVMDGDWFEDDIVTRFRQFLRVALGEEHFEENLHFVIESLGVKDLRDYFAKRGTKATTSQFYDDHVQRYKKRPIYWLFSSPKGSFNALIYMHRYTPSTVSTVLNEYLREFKAKLTATLGQQERLAAGGGTPRHQAVAQKESDRIRKMLLELNEYEHDVLYPLASQQIEIDLDDGVKVNYPKFGAALQKISGLEASE